MADPCFICGGGAFDHLTPHYRHCRACGHEILTGEHAQAYIINDDLGSNNRRRTSALDRFQSAVLERFAAGRQRRRLVDIGSGSGRFLARNGARFRHACGVEITPESVNFSRNTLGLEIVGDIDAVAGEIDVATAWHSLEHFPATALQSLLRSLAAKAPAGGIVIVSVPNAASFQYRFFRQHFAFFDVPSHLHQFTAESLNRLFASHGFAPRADAVSWPYNIFGWAQGVLNCLLPGHNYLYYTLKRGRPRGSLARDAANFALAIFAAPLGVALSIFDAAFPARQAVLTRCFEKRP